MKLKTITNAALPLAALIIAAPQAHSSEFNIQGYGSIVAGKTFSSDNSFFVDPPTASFYDSNLAFGPDSIIAVQASTKIAESTEVTVQGVARGGKDFEPVVEWAYITHTLQNGDRVSVGKKRLPFFFYSDYLDVGYAYPNVRLPYELYQLAISTYQGASYTTSHKFSDVISGKLEVFYGNSSGGDALTEAALGFPITLKTEKLKGASYTIESEEVAVRLIYSHSGLSVTRNSDEEMLIDTSVSSYGVAFKYDNSDFFITSEYINYDLESAINSNSAFFLTPGFRVGDYSIFATYAELNERADNVSYANSMNTRSVGLRYEASSNSALKVEVFDSKDTSDVDGGLFGDSKSFAIAYDFIF